MKKRIFISFSGGRTSAYMTWLLWNDLDHSEWDIAIGFANTGEEHEGTLEFVHKFEQVFDIPVTWIEAVINPVHGQGITHKIVTFDTASRNGEPFEAMIAKYGLPGQPRPFCSDYMKRDPLRSWLRRGLGWKSGSYQTAIGIRSDEIDRMSSNMDKERLLYPLVKMGIRKADILTWWKRRSFDLSIPAHHGNCKWCWKKSLRIHMTIARDNPEFFDFPRRMEKEYDMVKSKTDEPYRMFRENSSVDDIFKKSRLPLVKFTEDELEISNGCSDSCEIDFG